MYRRMHISLCAAGGASILTLTSRSLIFKMAHNLDLRCVLISDPSTLGPGAKIRLESRIKQLTPHCVCRQCKCGVNFFILDSRRARCWDQNTSQIQILRHFDKIYATHVFAVQCVAMCRCKCTVLFLYMVARSAAVCMRARASVCVCRVGMGRLNCRYACRTEVATARGVPVLFPTSNRTHTYTIGPHVLARTYRTDLVLNVRGTDDCKVPCDKNNGQ